jgi:hypothetical protein
MSVDTSIREYMVAAEDATKVKIGNAWDAVSAPNASASINTAHAGTKVLKAQCFAEEKR